MRENVFKRIGHGGASALAPANTLASFDVALEIGVDMVEFDVRSWRGELVLAHTILHAPLRANVLLRDALSHLAGRRFRDIELNVDVKHVGCEWRLLSALSTAGLLERTVICSQVPEVLDRVRKLEPRARVGISIGGFIARASRRLSDWRTHVLAGLAERRWDVLLAQHRLIDSALLEDVRERGGLLYAWTVNQRSAIDGLRALGVHGIATADPRLFEAPARAHAPHTVNTILPTTSPASIASNPWGASASGSV
jgi:glycerophosphoryl diester phosphodiesterase